MRTLKGDVPQKNNPCTSIEYAGSEAVFLNVSQGGDILFAAQGPTQARGAMLEEIGGIGGGFTTPEIWLVVGWPIICTLPSWPCAP
mmetsp:Transcript_104675/g.213487  ORF Transcript_104675/g.213487 Transcript_104675/m.213487 type:complete len:86 (-) Transcript_104675:96-353(-)